MVRTNRSKSGASNVRVPVYLTEEEKQQAVAIAGTLSLSEHFRISGLKLRKPVILPEVNREAYVELGKLRLELIRVGTNLNQLARSNKALVEQGQGSKELVKQIGGSIASLEELLESFRQIQKEVIALEPRKAYGSSEES